MHEDTTEEKETRRQQRMNVMKDMTKKIRSKGGMAAVSDGGLLSCWRQTLRKRGSIQKEQKPCKDGTFGWKNEKGR